MGEHRPAAPAERAPAIVLRVELDGVGEPITGRLGLDDEPLIGFVGWVGFAAAMAEVTAARLAREPQT